MDLGTESIEGNIADPMVMEPGEPGEDDAPCTSSVRTSSAVMVPIIFGVCSVLLSGHAWTTSDCRHPPLKYFGWCSRAFFLFFLVFSCFSVL
ncbi:unnamed protein product [Ectocarpus sp. 8 AP-2014]